jgi:hypothetical protein
MTPEHHAIQDEEKNSGVAEEGEQDEESEDDPRDHNRSRMGPMRFSGTRTLPRVCTFLTVP